MINPSNPPRIKFTDKSPSREQINRENELIRVMGNMHADKIAQALYRDVIERLTIAPLPTSMRLLSDSHFVGKLNEMDECIRGKSIVDVLRAYDYCIRALS